MGPTFDRRDRRGPRPLPAYRAAGRNPQIRTPSGRGSGRSLGAFALAVALALCPQAARSGERGLDVLAVSGYSSAVRACVDDSVPPAFCGTVAPDAYSVAIGDIDSDGHPDIAFARVSEPGQACLNDGHGLFTCAPIIGARDDQTQAVLGDFNRDGRMDVVLGASFMAGPSPPPAQICFNLGGTLVCAILDAVDYYHTDLAVGDLNGDGAPDLVTAASSTFLTPSRVCLNDGKGVFVSCADLGSPQLKDRAVALGDLDSDGDLDAVFATTTAVPDRVCLGNGSGLFACTELSEEVSNRGVDIGDVDGDGTLDLVFVGGNSTYLCPGAGDGSFPSCLPLPPETWPSWAVSLADLDGDGRPEMAFAREEEEETNRLCRFLGYPPPPGGEPLLDCQLLDPGISGLGFDVALWTPWIFQDGFESGDTSRWSSAVR